MKRVLLLVAFVCSAITINAQEENEAYKVDTQRLVKIVSESAFTPVLDQFSSMVAEDKKEALIAEIKATFPDLYAAIAVIYMEEFSHEEIKGILAFYETPVGKKLADKTGALSQKGMTAGQAWGMKIQGILQKYQ
jgi:hypothetical protein